LALRHPKQNYPLQFDWKKMYMERLELEKRWLGTAYTQVPIPLPEEPPCVRETGRSMNSRGGPRSRSLSPARLLRSGSNISGPLASGSVDHLAESTTVGRAARRTMDLRGLPASQTEPANMNVLYKTEKWEPEMKELKGHTDRCVDYSGRKYVAHLSL
jgi:hypothetical protein